MLLPIETLASKGRCELFRAHNFQFIIECTPMEFTCGEKELQVAPSMVWVGGGWGAGNEMHWLPYGKGE